MIQKAVGGASLVQQRFFRNPLIRGIMKVFGRVASFKECARLFYFEVILSSYQCPMCSGRLYMTGKSECSCSCGNIFDPTVTFQKSPCCDQKLVRKTYHYACYRCNKVIASRFLFDEKVFDASYFKKMMAESRKRAKRKKDEITRLFAESRSNSLQLMDNPDLSVIPGLVLDLDNFIGIDTPLAHDFCTDLNSEFSMQKYREHILSTLDGGSRVFSGIEALIKDSRLDRIWRFVTLIFMQHDGEVQLTQYGTEI